jgi:hypothetical protein
MGNRILFWNSFNTLECKVFNRLIAYVPMALANPTTYGILSHSILSLADRTGMLELSLDRQLEGHELIGHLL